MDPIVVLPSGVFAFPAAIVRELDVTRLDAVMKANHALDASAFDDNPAYFWSARISTNELDTYFTRMAESSLRNYAADAQAGVSFQNSHRTGELPFGRSLEGRFQTAGVDGIAAVEADFYTAQGLNLNGVSTDDLIRGIKLGILHDVSIGFYPGADGMFRCSECGRDMLRDWDCRHYPGVHYDVLDDSGAVRETRVATAWVENFHLSEVSAVYDGSCPSAAILKARSRAAAGQLETREITSLEQRYRTNLPGPGHVAYPAAQPNSEPKEAPVSVPGNGNPPAASSDDANVRIAADFAALQRRVSDFRVGMAAHGYDPSGDEDPMAFANRFIAEQTPMVNDGRAYRESVVQDALTEGARARGSEFDRATYEPLLRGAPIETVKRMTADWKAVADATLPAGRSSVDAEQPARQNGQASVRAGDRSFQS